MADVREVGGVHATTNVVLTDGVETVAVSSGQIVLPSETATIWIVAFAQVTLAASTTGLIPRIRRGTTITGTAVGDAVTIDVVASDIVQVNMMVSEDRASLGSVEYSLTLLDVAGGADGSILQSSILVFIL